MSESNENKKLAEYIFEWLEDRNGGELRAALDAMSVGSYRRALGELEMILDHRGKPPNWIK